MYDVTNLTTESIPFFTMERSKESSLEKAESLRSVSTVEKPSTLMGVDGAEERRAVRKLDLCQIPIMTLFYLLSFLVRPLQLIFRDIFLSMHRIVLT